MKKGIFLTAIILMVTLIVSAISIYTIGQSPYKEAKQEALAVAKKEAGVTDVQEFYWYNGSKTYFSVVGNTAEGAGKVVIIDQKNGKATVLNQNETITKKQAIQLTVQAKKPKKILSARIGIEEKVPVWEVAYKQDNGRLGYYFITLKTGDWIKDIGNI